MPLDIKVSEENIKEEKQMLQDEIREKKRESATKNRFFTSVNTLYTPKIYFISQFSTTNHSHNSSNQLYP